MTTNDSPMPHPYEDRDILNPLTDPWDAQSHIIVLREHGQLAFHHVGVDEAFTLLDEAPDPATVYIRPRRGTDGYRDLQRVENVVTRGVENAGGKLALDDACKQVEALGIDRSTAENMLRYLVGRGDLVAEVTGKRKVKISFKLSPIAREREDHRTYASSFAHELTTQAEQIGRLIGHGSTIGSEREELLRALIERHVPTRFHVATGFIEGKSPQIDILIYDQVEYAPLFRTGNLVVVPVEAVRALIEVKSTLTGESLKDALAHLEDAVAHQTQGPPIFRGVFGYQGATSKTLVDAMVEHHREPTDFESGGNPVFSIYDMATAVCVLRKIILITGFDEMPRKSGTARTPIVVEYASEAGRDLQAALFFDRLMRHLRHPFIGPLTQGSLGDRFAVDIASRSTRELYAGSDWGPYVIDTGIARVEGEIAAHDQWLAGEAWRKPPADTD